MPPSLAPEHRGFANWTSGSVASAQINTEAEQESSVAVGELGLGWGAGSGGIQPSQGEGGKKRRSPGRNQNARKRNMRCGMYAGTPLLRVT